jgi:hypothetical protein
VNQLSTARKLGVILKVGTRAARQRAGRSRTLGAITSAGRATVRSFGHVIRQLWLEVTGAIFIFMAGVGGIETVREWSKYHAGRGTSSHVAVAICFTVTFAWFGFSSFWRVRQKDKKARQ